MARKEVKALTTFLAEHGWEWCRQNTKGFDIWKRIDDRQDVTNMVKVYDGLTDRDVKQTIHRLSRELGIESPADGKKRRPDQIKDRQAREREQAAIDLARVHDELAALRQRKEDAAAHARAVREFEDRTLDGHGRYLTRDEQLAVARQIEEMEAEATRLERIMQRAPLLNSHRHRA